MRRNLKQYNPIFETPLVRELADAIQKKHSFKVARAELYLEGYCPHCEEKESE